MDRGAWQATVYGIPELDTMGQIIVFSFHNIYSFISKTEF